MAVMILAIPIYTSMQFKLNRVFTLRVLHVSPFAQSWCDFMGEVYREALGSSKLSSVPVFFRNS
jgi:hypothetical protein